jgi:hypothetical protein
MSDLDLPEEITISYLRGGDPDAAVETLEHLVEVTQHRGRHLAGRGLRLWDGPKTVVVIVPSSEVFASDHRIVQRAQVLARIGRACGISLRLIDVTPPLREADRNGPAVYSLAACGSTILREYINSSELATVSFHQVSAREMAELAENA